MKRTYVLLTVVLLCALSPIGAFGRTISVNLYNSSAAPTDHQIRAQDAAGKVPVAGTAWNQTGFPAGDLAGGTLERNVSLNDDAGNANAGVFISTLQTAYVGNSGAVDVAPESGDRRLMASSLHYEAGMDAGHLRIENLSTAFTVAGYHVYVYFDTGANNRTLTVTLTPDGEAARTAVGEDSGTFSGEWAEAVGHGAYANYAVFTNLSASAFTLTMQSNTGRGAVNGIQVVSADHPMPPEIVAFTVDDGYVGAGTTGTLSWTVSGADDLRLDPAPGDVSGLTVNETGSWSFVAATTTVYTLTASNAVGAAAVRVRVDVGPPRPNIVFFFIDDMGWQDTSVPFYETNGTPVVTTLNGRYRTPNMETLASQGVKFTQAYACALCSPSRVSLMTGLNAARHRVTNWTLRKDTAPDPYNAQIVPAAWNVNGLSPVAGVPNTCHAVTLPMLLREAGYRTIHAGKAHFGANDTPGEDPHNQGFDVNIAGHCAGGPGSYYGINNFSAAFRGGDRIWDVPGLGAYHGQDIYLNDALTIEANKAVEQAVTEGRPFYLYMSHYAVHAPFEGDTRFNANYPGLSGHSLTYATMIESMDKSLGDIMARLDTLGVADNTIVVFMSDNGSPSNNPQNWPLRGHKITRFEGGTRVPMIAGWPGVTVAGTTCTEPIIIEDIFPTFLEMAGVTEYQQIGGIIDGISFAPLLRGQPPEHADRAFFWHYPHVYGVSPWSSVREGDWKLVYNYTDQTYELYNIVDDIGEGTNLAASKPALLYRMAQLLIDGLDELGATYPTRRDTGTVMRPALPVEPPAVDVYLLGGQSNMQGLGTVSELTDELKAPMTGVKFWNGSVFETLDPGSTVLGSSAAQFGPEVGVARLMRGADPERDVYLIKYHNSGKPLDSGWNDQVWVGDPPAPGRVNFYPGETAGDPNRGTLYTAMLSKFKAGLAALDDEGLNYEIKGLAWVQGEQDSKNAVSAGHYAPNLARLNRRLEQDLNLSTGALQVAYAQVLGMPDGIAPARFTDRLSLRQSMANADAQSGHADSVATAHMVSTDGLNYHDDVHFNTSGQLILGDQLGRALSLANGQSVPASRGRAVINVNFGISGNDSDSVNVDESAAGNVPSAPNVGGEHWNQVLLRGSGAGEPTTFTSASQGGSVISLRDRQGNLAATMSSMGADYANFADVTPDALRGATGEAGMMQSCLLVAGTNEAITVSGLSQAFTERGYDLCIYFEAAVSRTYRYGVTPAGGSTVFSAWGSDAGDNSDADDDGAIEWKAATGATPGTANSANYVVISNLVAAAFTLHGESTSGRAAINALQLVARPCAVGGKLRVRSGLGLWLDASDLDGDGSKEEWAESGYDRANGSVATWANKASTGNDANPGTAPTYVPAGGISGADIVTFGGSHSLIVNGMDLGGDVCVLAVVRREGADGQVFNSAAGEVGGGTYVLEFLSSTCQSGYLSAPQQRPATSIRKRSA